jgi:hypothetical protein
MGYIVKKEFRGDKVKVEAVQYALDMQAKGFTLLGMSESNRAIQFTHEGEKSDLHLEGVTDEPSKEVISDKEETEDEKLEDVPEPESQPEQLEEDTIKEPLNIDWSYAESIDDVEGLLEYLSAFDFTSQAKTTKSILKAAKKALK